MKREELLQIAKPILFNAKIAKAILDDTKTQTRRITNCTNGSIFKCLGTDKTKNSTTKNKFGALFELPKSHWIDKNSLSHEFVASKYKIGDILWAREPAKVLNSHGDKYMTVEYLSDGFITTLEYPERFASSLPRWIAECKGVPNGCIKEMARFFLKVTNVRVEQLHDISDDDCLKEGINSFGGGQIADTGDYFETEYFIGEEKLSEDEMYYENETFEEAYLAFANLWNSTAPKGYKWEDNPYVFVYEFERVEYV